VTAGERPDEAAQRIPMSKLEAEGTEFYGGTSAAAANK
jgi:hypothetical protein